MNFYKNTFLTQIKQVTLLYYESIHDREINLQREIYAASRLQENFKSQKVYFIFKLIVRAARKIQKYGRIFLAKSKKRALQNKQKIYQNVLCKKYRYFSFQATIIQKNYRGYMQRKLFSFSKRQQKLKQLKQKNTLFIEELKRNEIIDQARDYMFKLKQAKEEFVKIAQDMHHLTSTKQIPGIFNRPFQKDSLKIIKVDLDTQIKLEFKKKLRTKIILDTSDCQIIKQKDSSYDRVKMNIRQRSNEKDQDSKLMLVKNDERFQINKINQKFFIRNSQRSPQRSQFKLNQSR